MKPIIRDRHVTIYMDDWQCAPGSGGHLRLRSNATAFRDLGWSVEVVRLESTPSPVPAWATARGIHWVSELGGSMPSDLIKALGRVQYRLGLPSRAACDYYFPKHRATCEAVRRRRGTGRLHVLEGIQMANVLPFLGDERVIFSHHDIWHEATAAALLVQQEVAETRSSASDARELRFLRTVETRLHRVSRHVLTISARDCATLQREGWTHVEYLPMSIAETPLVARQIDPLAPLRILHIGRLAHLPSFRSLEFLFEQVFPLLSGGVLEHLRLRIVGTLEPGNPRTNRILGLLEPFAAHVELAGFVEDLDAEFSGNDIQIVAATAVSGLQTRIVESLANGLPVLASEMAAQGLESPRSGENLLIAQSAREFAESIVELIHHRHRILDLAEGGRRYFQQCHAPRKVADRLGAYLFKSNL